MCNLYRMSKSAAEVARLFKVERIQGGNAGEFVYPGHPGWVVGQNHMKTMHWGFPLALKGKSGQPLKPKPVNNTRSDKLTSPFWHASFEHRRCLIPMTAFAEAEGRKRALGYLFPTNRCSRVPESGATATNGARSIRFSLRSHQSKFGRSITECRSFFDRINTTIGSQHRPTPQQHYASPMAWKC